MNKKPKTYLKCFAREHTFTNGGSVIKLSVNKEDFNKLPDNKGYVRLIVSKKSAVDKFNNTHYVYLDEFEPKGKSESGSSDLPF